MTIVRLRADILRADRASADRWYVTNGATAVGPVALELVAAVRANEPGCLLYTLSKGDDPLTYVFMERYKDDDALKNHRGTDHFRTLGGRQEHALAGGPQHEQPMHATVQQVAQPAPPLLRRRAQLAQGWMGHPRRVGLGAGNANKRIPPLVRTPAPGRRGHQSGRGGCRWRSARRG